MFADQGDEIRYIIIRQTNGVRCFPKGHMEEGETEEETAVREIKEETGIDVTLVDGFCEYDNYRFTLDDQTVIDKDVVYFLGRITSGALVPQEGELEEIQLLPFDEAYEMLQFDRSKDILKQADELIRKNR